MDINAITLIGKNNKLLINILANNFKPKDLRDIIELNNSTWTQRDESKLNAITAILEEQLELQKEINKE